MATTPSMFDIVSLFDGDQTYKPTIFPGGEAYQRKASGQKMKDGMPVTRDYLLGLLLAPVDTYMDGEGNVKGPGVQDIKNDEAARNLLVIMDRYGVDKATDLPAEVKSQLPGGGVYEERSGGFWKSLGQFITNPGVMMALGAGVGAIAGAGGAGGAAGGAAGSGAGGAAVWEGLGGLGELGGTLAASPAAPAVTAGALGGAGAPAATSVPTSGATTSALGGAATAGGALSQAELAALVESGTGGLAGGALEAGALGAGSIDSFLASMPTATQSVLGTLGLGTASEALDKMLKLGLPIATIAGLFEEPNNPLLGPIVQAANKAIGQADIYAGLGPVGLTPAQQQAIDLAKSQVGSYKPYVDKAGALADTAAGGITQDQIDRYTNPYIDDVLNPAITDIEEASARRREELRAITSRSGNDLRTPSTVPNRFNVEDSLLDRETLRAIGDVSGKLRAQGFDSATGLAGKDLDRSLSSSSLYGGLGKTVGALGASDVESLKGAGALERLPQDEERTHAANASKLYTDVVHGNQGALAAAAQPSTLTNVTGALGALKTAKDLDLF